MKSRIRDFLIGVTAIAGLVGVAALLILFGEIRAAAMGHYRVHLHIDDASGISGASRVTLNGVRVGYLGRLRTADDPRRGVVLDLVLNNGVRIPRDVSVLLERGLVGEATLALRTQPLDPGVPDPGYLQPDETLRTTAINIIDEIGNQISAALEAHIGDLGSAVDSFSEMSSTLSSIAQQAKELVEPRTVADVEGGESANIPSTLARLDSALTSAQGWLGDEQLQGDVREVVDKTVATIDSVAGAVDSWTEAAHTIGRRSDTLGEQAETALTDFALMTRSLTEVIEQTRTITTQINQGEGTIGMLVKNPDLYRSLNDAAIRLEKALTEAQLLIEK